MKGIGMSSYAAHWHQAKRNENLAAQLLSDLTYKEWVVVTAFYSAVHYVEAALYMEPGVGHSDTSMPKGSSGSYHDHRQDLVLQHFSGAWKSYSKLRYQSMVARYLTTSPGQFLQKPVEDYFSDRDVRDFVTRDLRNVQRGVGFS